ncbi:protein SUPPRESSOR OF npr1-1, CONSTITUTIVE 1-like [Camellia sinensis]|uniref:protein SUPPRESSOR OF npr1-1, CONSTITUTIVE 1-like n=1 Tax=Camellia sinensis TaxID=4442 RepID=UPI00103669C3|nr:protein SUPPRESSOR OF npr1-1, CONSTITUTIVE 1-like [Camellia sinensis]
MGGIGKTTLAQLIYDDDGVKNHFDLKAWVYVSDEFDVKRITKAILESFTLQSCDLIELTNLQGKLEVTLPRKKFLLVLDDVWNHRDEEWSSLQSPLQVRAHGSKDELPDSIGDLKHLRCPELVGRLPNDLPRGKSLDINRCSQLLIDASRLVFPSLMSLFMSHVMLPSLPALLEMKNKLDLDSFTLDISFVTVLDFFYYPNIADEVLLDNATSKNLTSITALDISCVENLVFLPTWFTQGLMGLEKLGISNCKEFVMLWENNSKKKKEGGWKKEQHEGFSCMTRLEYLNISNCGVLEKLLHDLHTYTSFGVLKMDNCKSLVSFPKKGLPPMLAIDTCNALESLPELMTLNNLRVLWVSKCAKLTYLTPRGGLPSMLNQLWIEVCRKLESLFAEEGVKMDGPSLESIRIQYCERLKSLPNANNLRNLGQLEIRSCYNLESLSLGALDENNNNINQLTSL